MLLAVNCQWTTSRDVGQLWDVQLRRRAAALVDDTAPPWQTVYCLQPVYTSRGRCGIVFCAFPGPWRLFAIAAEQYESGARVSPGELILTSDIAFSRSEIVDALRRYSDQQS